MRVIDILDELNDLEQRFCTDCFLKKTLKETESKTSAHRFCISSCTVGKQLQFIGQELIKHRS
ncbi:zinc-finger domain-containing protein [Paenisporosarcina cavernae]|uniref:zinc-finger domain-containing protein n=1 Tax=Paenisporosarcina cavernae TaxID=2320858 RepID=UPI001EE5A0F5|nr:zinc-finger domain-containing protein [Paenisporosarcina cavernae]